MKNAKRILVVTRSTIAHKGAGGMEAVFDDIVQHLANEHFEFALLTTPGLVRRDLSDSFSQIWTVPNSRPGKYSLKWWLFSASSRSEWRDWNPDVILSISNAAASFAVNPAWGRVPIISQCHGTASREVLSSLSSITLREIAKIPVNVCRVLRERVAYKQFRRILSIGSGVTKQLTGFPLFIDPSKILTIPNAVDIDYWRFSKVLRNSVRQQLDIDLSIPLAVFSGRLHRQKGADLAIRALAEMPDDKWQLLICGDGPELAHLKKLGKNLGLSGRLHFAGRVGRSQVSAYMSASDLLVFPTRRHEGLPMNCLEALASGLPVLTVDRANLSDDVGTRVFRSRLDPKCIAEAWSKIDRVRDRDSSLSHEYEIPVMLTRYQTALLEA